VGGILTDAAQKKRERRMRRKLTRRCCSKCFIEPPQGFDCEIDQCPRELVEMRRSRRAWERADEIQDERGT